jgi:hypothetical protein
MKFLADRWVKIRGTKGNFLFGEKEKEKKS